jgi:hypothetical protein
MNRRGLIAVVVTAAIAVVAIFTRRNNVSDGQVGPPPSPTPSPTPTPTPRPKTGNEGS